MQNVSMKLIPIAEITIKIIKQCCSVQTKVTKKKMTVAIADRASPSRTLNRRMGLQPGGRSPDIFSSIDRQRLP
jgi:hypothetical protein